MSGLPPLRTTPARHKTGRGWVWVRCGFDIFNKGMGISVAMVLVWFLVGMLLDQLPAGSLISQLLYMVWGAGWVAVAARGYRGAPLQFADLFAGFRHKLTPLMLGGLLVLLLFSLVGLVCLGLLSMWGLLSVLAQDPESMVVSATQLQQLLLVLLVGMVLLIPVLMAVTFAPALIYFHDVSIIQAVRLSFFGCWRNMWPFFWWGLLSAMLLLFGAALLLVGLLVVIPALNYSIYVAYRDIFLDERAKQEAPNSAPFGFEA
ncbi:BPSS1780 family membrane protein [Aeromonas fluvialis]|uniref:BPSS1780 family membrane protein n=1 Tax=Aeromonas fluvialis TaxID=591962 RepID=UPI0005A96609|nr:BPSS1780 family membrane protein [Aeromonas fluvialis]